MYKPGLVAGTLMAALAVILGAFGAHALKAVLTPDQLNTFETGVKYQFYHSFALLAAGIMYKMLPFKAIRYSVWLFIAGIVLFSGSLYLLTLTKINGEVGLNGLGMVTPFGGLFFIAGWITLMLGSIKKK